MTEQKFNLYDSINSTDSSKTITFDELIKEVTTNDTYVSFARLFRGYYGKGEGTYEKIKEQEIPTFYPNAFNPKKRKNKNDPHESTGLIYLDIDRFESQLEAVNYKCEICYKKDYIKACWLSLSDYGITILVKSEYLTESNYSQYWEALNKEFDNKLDKFAKGYYRQCCISVDHEVFVNEDCKSFIPPTNSDKQPTNTEASPKDKPIIHQLAGRQSQFGENEQKWVYTKEFLSDEYFENVNIPHVCLEGIGIIEVNTYPSFEIKDGNRHNQLSAILTQLIYLNPTIKRDRLLNYLYWLNNKYCIPPLRYEEVVKIFYSIKKSYTEGKLNPDKYKKIKHVFWSQHCRLDGKQKLQLAMKELSSARKDQTAQEIHDAVCELQTGKKITQVAIAKKINKCRETVNRSINKFFPEIKELITDYNQSLKKCDCTTYFKKEKNSKEIGHTLSSVGDDNQSTKKCDRSTYSERKKNSKELDHTSSNDIDNYSDQQKDIDETIKRLELKLQNESNSHSESSIVDYHSIITIGITEYTLGVLIFNKCLPLSNDEKAMLSKPLKEMSIPELDRDMEIKKKIKALIEADNTSINAERLAKNEIEIGEYDFNKTVSINDRAYTVDQLLAVDLPLSVDEKLLLFKLENKMEINDFEKEIQIKERLNS